MPSLDIFRSDAFGMAQLTAAALKLPYKPARLGQLGLFRESGIITTTALIEEKDGRLSLIQSSPRGGPASTIGQQKRKMRSFVVPHLERESTIMADEVQNVRAFGSDNETVAVESIVNERMTDLRAMHEVTLERHRVSALQGIVLDADGSTLLNLFTAFEVSQNTYELDLSPADEAAGVRSQMVQAMRKSEYVLGGETISNFRVLCGDTFFDLLVDSPGVQATLAYQQSATLRTDLRKGFEYAGVIWENYRGRVAAAQPTSVEDEQSTTPFIADDEAYMFPEGTSVFRTFFAPADFMETVNTVGLPMYVKQVIDDDLNRWVRLHSQSNPLCINLRPRAVVKITLGS